MTGFVLACARCGQKNRAGVRVAWCGPCGGALVVRLDVRGAAPDPSATTALLRYQAFLPFRLDPAGSLGEGGTPLVVSRSIGPLLGMASLAFKLETHNPFGTYADRGWLAGVQWAAEMGVTRLGVVVSVWSDLAPAAYAARAGLVPIVIFREPPDARLRRAMQRLGGRAIVVQGTPTDLHRIVDRAARGAGVLFLHPRHPVCLEGVKTLAFELAEAPAGRNPEYVIVPSTATPSTLALKKGFREWWEAGRAEREPIVLGLAGLDDRDADAARQLLATEEGILASRASGSALAGLIREVRSRRLPADARTVVVLSGPADDPPISSDDLDDPLPVISPRGLRQALLDLAR